MTAGGRGRSRRSRSWAAVHDDEPLGECAGRQALAAQVPGDVLQGGARARPRSDDQVGRPAEARVGPGEDRVLGRLRQVVQEFRRLQRAGLQCAPVDLAVSALGAVRGPKPFPGSQSAVARPWRGGVSRSRCCPPIRRRHGGTRR
ncbi:hypothetical protein Srubr_62900 [Streptomyces rubradiris]|uniref:Uncharacterized protein n=1 Tax=Streptomyces rubradiris TaxID=285531 RepID=A0ABQ3RKR4_STRRR|nr:hypothetical protein GCM10018792_35890 [Streptomyces rubradiris]GHI56444.1 hypothetical protein Srubr_62900 [Streptomyces rubradiris]